MRTGLAERMVIAECQAGIRWEGGGTGSFCKKRDLCRSEGRCHFLGQAELHLERVVTQELKRRQALGIGWSHGTDDWWEREAA